MRTQLFRTDPVLVNGAGVIVALKDLDGADPITLTVENMDLAATLTAVDAWGSKNSKLLFTAKTAGTGGNSVRVKFTTGASQAFSVGVSGNDITINLACTADARPYQLTTTVMDLVNADSGAAALVVVSLAPGSDGSAVAPTTPSSFTNLAGGAAANDTGAATVEEGPTAAGPWVANSGAGTALSTITANSAKSTQLVDRPMRGLRVKVSKGASNTSVVVTAVTRKKS